MNLVLVIAGLTLVAIPGATTGLGARLAPHEWTRLTAASLRAGLLAVQAGLLVTAAPAILRLARIPGLAEACHHALGPIAPGGTITGIASGAVVVLVQARAFSTRHRSRQTRTKLRIESWLGQHEAHQDHELVVLPTSSTIAYALDGRPPQIVLSQGLANALSDDELASVIRHEVCHLEHGHQRYLDLSQTIDAAFGFLRPVRRSTATLRLAIERWADETAAGDRDRSTVRGALTKVVESLLAPAPAFTAAETIGARLDALATDRTRPPARWRLAATAPSIALAGVICGALLTGPGPIHHGVLGLLGFCSL